MINSLNIIYGSINGNTEYVMGRIEAFLRTVLPGLIIRRVRAETAKPDDFKLADALLLGSGTWNTGGDEGQLNPHMHALLFEHLKDVRLPGKPMAFVSLGDEQHHFITDCIGHFRLFLQNVKGEKLLQSLILVNDPYTELERIDRWAKDFSETLATADASGKPDDES
ncbi:MAG: flavodoxin domain-containing protein [Candidatus Peribacteraceae bacterium]|nr:flavodoxin domain-containing protein [Candidatus Peribacteraceae bacterium]